MTTVKYNSIIYSSQFSYYLKLKREVVKAVYEIRPLAEEKSPEQLMQDSNKTYY